MPLPNAGCARTWIDRRALIAQGVRVGRGSDSAAGAHGRDRVAASIRRRRSNRPGNSQAKRTVRSIDTLESVARFSCDHRRGKRTHMCASLSGFPTEGAWG
ncbi:hypothetical protein EKJ_08400 [Qipengyuania flava]|uniref:Uncharacterized protein n=1 Tax=Qipengyuania flava TaxID=192812 RepID=A0A3T1CGF3_9SPHN|nr:hypothetical protein EKJ_08400 [Qipengyuania flava]